MMNLNTRNASYATIVGLLRQRQAVAHDLVVPASQLRSRDAVLRVKGAEQHISMDGVTNVDGAYRPTQVADEGIATKLGMPVAYLRKLRNEAPDLYDANVNGWLHGKQVRRAAPTPQETSYVDVIRPADQRSFMLRTFRNQDGGEGVARAFLSDRYDVVDDLDALVAVLGAVRDSGIDVEIPTADLTDRNMFVRVTAPQIQALAPELLKGYRSPFTGESGTDNPVVFAGFEIRNSEVGCGAFSIVPMITVRICKNGMTFTKEAYRKVHLGGKLDQGVIVASAETRRKNIDLIKSQTKDAVRAFLNPEYVAGKVAELERQAGIEVTSPEKTVKAVCKKLAFSEAEAEGILGHFVKGGQLTAGGIMNAITSYSQTVDSADRARVLDDAAVESMALLGR
jgi:hypothetical protein